MELEVFDEDEYIFIFKDKKSGLEIQIWPEECSIQEWQGFIMSFSNDTLGSLIFADQSNKVVQIIHQDRIVEFNFGIPSIGYIGVKMDPSRCKEVFEKAYELLKSRGKKEVKIDLEKCRKDILEELEDLKSRIKK